MIDIIQLARLHIISYLCIIRDLLQVVILVLQT